MIGKVCCWFLIVAIIAVLNFYSVNAMGLGWFGNDLQGNPCKGGDQGFGPFDYFDINDPSDKLWVEGRLYEIDKIHYGKGKNYLTIKPTSSSNLRLAASEFDYTLRAIPNHPYALHSVIELEIAARQYTQTTNIPRSSLDLVPPECYLQRALVFRPKQAHIPLLFGLYLHKLGIREQAMKYYQQSLGLQPENAEAHYNTGLLYFDMKDYANSKIHARRAYQLGYPLPGLRKKLVSVGQWP